MKEKTRNGKRWTEARYRSFITSALRGAFRRWAVKFDVLKASFTSVKTNRQTGRKAQHYRCSKCAKDFPQKQVQVDHIVPIGRDLSWDEFIEKLFCERDNLQVLCKTCHKEKTKSENKIYQLDISAGDYDQRFSNCFCAGANSSAHFESDFEK